MFIRSWLLRRMLDEFADRYPGMQRPAYADYLKHHEFRMRVAGPTHTLFGARCFVCGVKAKAARYANNNLATAHIVYPPEPFTEVIDPTDLTRSDVVLLCSQDHRFFDSLTQHRPFDTIDEMREFSLDMLDRMRIGRSVGEELPADDDE